MLTVAALYRFTPFDDPAALKPPLVDAARAHGVRGTLLLAYEGINGTIAAPPDGMAAMLRVIRALPGCAEIEVKESHAAEMPFSRMKVRLKREIVTLNQPQVDPNARVGTYVAPANWNALIAQDDVVVIDTRNDYETAIGTFEGAIDPATKSFGEFPDWWADNAARFAGKRVAMFCTGGIRCEKASSYLLGEGVEEVFHLQGGILKYLEQVPEAESRWRGDCYVFDGRVSVTHGLEQGAYTTCFACGRPLSPADLTVESYEEGVSCHRCKDEYSDADRARFRERQRQIALAKERASK
ncbi:MAG: rhodanese-related sulfurtransferase [Pseudomonadota bacterium]